MNTDRETIRMMLNEYLDGELTPPQATQVAAALADDAELAREYDELLATRQAVGSLRGIAAPQGMAERIMHAANHHVFPTYELPQPAGGFGKFFRIQLIAAAAVVFIAVGMGLYLINTLSKSQETQQTVAIEYPKSKALADEGIAKARGEKISFARPAAAPLPAKRSPTDNLSSARPVAAGRGTSETIGRLEEKIRADEPPHEAAADIKPLISPEPSLAMNDYKSIGGAHYNWDDDEKMRDGAFNETPDATTPPVLQAPKSVAVTRITSTEEKLKISYQRELTKMMAAPSAPAVAVKAEQSTTAEPEMAACEAAPAAPCAQETKSPVVAIAKKTKLQKETKACEISEIQDFDKPAEDVKSISKTRGATVAKLPAQNQNILIETSNVSDTQTRLDKYFKSNNIQVVSTQQSQIAAVRSRNETLNRQIQNADTWADKEPVTLQYNIRTSQRQAEKINADLSKNFQSVPNNQQPSAGLATSNYAVAKDKSSAVIGTDILTNAADSNPVIMVITIRQTERVYSTMNAPTPTTAPASSPASQPATQQAK